MKKLKFLFLIVLTVLFFCSCQERVENLPPCADQDGGVHFTNNDTTNVSVEFAKKVASKYSTTRGFRDQNSRLKASINYTVRNVVTIPDTKSEPAMYVLNLNPRGFIVLSASKKESPVLGFSDSNNFDLNNIPACMAEWLYERMSVIQAVKNDSKYKVPLSVTSEWNNLSIQNFLKAAHVMVLEQYGPFLQTTWGQKTPYNDKISQAGCLIRPDNKYGKAPTGCVATAIAQVLKYYHYGSKYNWAIMPNSLIPDNSGTAAANEVAQLMADVGSKVGMSYACGGSGANTANATKVFQDLGYSNTGTYNRSYATSNAESLVLNDIKARRPVIMDGADGHYSGWWIFKKLVIDAAHCWVCDGYKKEQLVFDYSTVVYTNNYYHMNWGHNGEQQGAADNFGWFSFSNIATSDGRNYQYSRNYLTNVAP